MKVYKKKLTVYNLKEFLPKTNYKNYSANSEGRYGTQCQINLRIWKT